VIKLLWEKLGIGEALRSIGKHNQKGWPGSYEQALLAMTANRLCEPESKLGVWIDGYQKYIFPPVITLKLDYMYESMDYFYDHAKEV